MPVKAAEPGPAAGATAPAIKEVDLVHPVKLGSRTSTLFVAGRLVDEMTIGEYGVTLRYSTFVRLVPWAQVRSILY